MIITVRNANGNTYNSGVPYGYTCWLDYWEKSKLVTASICRCCKRSFHNSDLVGGHVRSIYTNTLYITPLCRGCNNPNNTETIFVEKSDLVYVP